MKRLFLGILQLAFLPLLAAYVLVTALSRRSPVKTSLRPRRIALVTPFGAGTKSGSARAEKDLLEMLSADFEISVIALPDVRSQSGWLGYGFRRLLASTLAMEPRLWDFMVDPEPVVSRAKDADLVFVEFVYAALFLFRRPAITRPVVLRDHEVLARRYKAELSAARGPIDLLVGAVRLSIVWMITFHLYRQTDRIIALTEEDGDWVRRWFPLVGERVVVIPVPFRAEPVLTVNRDIKSNHILYAANFYHKPNVDGLLWFLRECAPTIDPDVTLHLVGLDEPLSKSHFPDSGLTIIRHGHVENIEDFCSAIPIAIAPMVSGGGIRVKNLLFGSLAKAIVTTPLGNEGIGFEHGKDAMICERPQDFAAAINQLIAEPDYAKLLGEAARSVVETKFSHEAIRARYASDVFGPMTRQA